MALSNPSCSANKTLKNATKRTNAHARQRGSADIKNTTNALQRPDPAAGAPKIHQNIQKKKKVDLTLAPNPSPEG